MFEEEVLQRVEASIVGFEMLANNYMKKRLTCMQKHSWLVIS